MAAAVTGLQLICGVGLGSRIVGLNQFAPLRSLPLRKKKDLKFRVRSMADQVNTMLMFIMYFLIFI